MASETNGELDAEVLDEELEDISDDDLLEEVLDDDDDDDDAAEGLEELDEDALVDTPVATEAVATETDETVVDDEDDLDDDEVEASLDVILKERLVVADDEDDLEDDETEATDAEDRADGSMRVLPKQPGEFVCQSCFLVKAQTQLADRKKQLCRDCV